MFSTTRSANPLSSWSSHPQPVTSPSSSSSSTPTSGLASLLLQSRQFNSLSKSSSTSKGKPAHFQVQVQVSDSSSTSPLIQPSDANLVRSIRVLLNSPTSKSPSQLTGSLQSLINDTQQIVQSSSPNPNSAVRCSGLYDKVQMEMEKAIGQLSRSLESDASSSGPEAAGGRNWLEQLNTGWLEWCDRCVSMGPLLTLLSLRVLC